MGWATGSRNSEVVAEAAFGESCRRRRHLGSSLHDPKRKPTLDLSEARLSAEVTTDAVMVSIPRAPSNPNSEIRIVRSRQPNPLAFIMFDWVLSADLFLPWREQAPISDKDGERRRKDVGVLHRDRKSVV